MNRSTAIVVAALAAVIISLGAPRAATAATFGDLIYSGFVENDLEAVVFIRVYVQRLANGTLLYIYDISAYPVGSSCPGAQGCDGQQLWTVTRPSNHEPSNPHNQLETNAGLDPNGNGTPIWRDPGDIAYPPVQIDYQ